METAAALQAVDPDLIPFPARPAPAEAEKRAELVLDALKRGIAEPGHPRRRGSLALQGSRLGRSLALPSADHTRSFLHSFDTVTVRALSLIHI